MKANKEIAIPYKKPFMEFKDEDGNITHTREAEVHTAVLSEIKKLGDNTKAQIFEMQSNYKKLKDAIDATSQDSIKKSEISKLSEDILTRQEEVTKKFTKEQNDRMDQVELSVKRMAGASGSYEGGESEAKLFKEAKQFQIDRLVAYRKLPKTGVEDKDVNVAEYKEYKKAIQMWFRINEKELPIFSPESYKYLTVGSDPDGGILVTPAMSASIVERIFEMDPIRQLASAETIGTDALEILEDLGQFNVDWEGETVPTSQRGTSQFSKKRIPVHIQSARPCATQSQIDDASLNIEQWIAKKVADRFGRAEAAAFVNGNGVNKPRGFLTYTDYTGTKGDGGVTMGQVEQRISGAAAGITTDSLITLKYSLVEDFLTRGTWLANRLTVAEIMKLKDGDGQYIWRPGLTEGQPSTLLGLPFRMSTTMPTIAAGALALALADWREAYQIVDRQGISIQRDPYTLKPFVEFYTRRRVGGDVKNFQAIKLMVVSA